MSNGITEIEFIKLAIAEDAGDGDQTSLATVDSNQTGSAAVMVKSEGILAGIEVAQQILRLTDGTLKLTLNSKDGDLVAAGKIVMTIEGNVRSLLLSERLLLNCMQRMSGIATMTRKFVDAVAGTNATILDTRKTTPNFRRFEKQAVRIGGGMNHRFGLFDMILIKDNHVDAAGGIGNALRKTGEYLKSSGKKLAVEIETRNLEEVKEVLRTGIATRIMMDNFKPDILKEAISHIGNKFETEASGGITLENVREYATTGVQYISVGALTHSYQSMDISMKIKI